MKNYLRLLKFVRPYIGLLLVAMLCSIVVSGVTGATAWLVKPVLDDIFIKKDVNMLALLPLGIIVLYVTKGAFGYIHSYLMKLIGAKVATDIRQSLYNHTINLPLRFYSDNSTGTLVSRFTSDVGGIQGIIADSLKNIFIEGFTLIVLAVIAFYRKWDLALISLVIFPLSAILIIKVGNRLRKIGRMAQDKIADVMAALSETFTGIKIVKAFGMEERESRKFEEKNKGYLNAIIKATKTAELTSPLVEVIGGIGVAVVVWYGGFQVVSGKISAGTFFSFIAAVLMLYTPIRRLSSVNNAVQQAIGASERIFYLLDTEPEPKSDGLKRITTVESMIEFKDVWFSYGDRKRDALVGIDLKVNAGEIVAFVGMSGGGKTTLVNLIPRFYEPTEGAILIDGINIRELTLESLRGLIGIVSQETILFNDTIRNNIGYGRKGASEDEIIDAARLAYAHDFIKDLPHGYDTVIGERGMKLSGGQRQRVSIARALLKDPPILILDEATSLLDPASEYYVQMALSNLMKDRTTFVIAHRLSTIKIADRIIVIDKGMIVEMGQHDELLKKGGYYSRLYRMQLDRELQKGATFI